MKKSVILLISLLTMSFAQTTFAEQTASQEASQQQESKKITYDLQLYIDGKISNAFPTRHSRYGSNFGRSSNYGGNSSIGEPTSSVELDLVPTKTDKGVELFGSLYGTVGGQPQFQQDVKTVVAFGAEQVFSFKMNGKTYDFVFKLINEA